MFLLFVFFFTKKCFSKKKISFFLAGEEGWRLANPKPKLVSSLGRGSYYPPPSLKKKLVSSLGRGSNPLLPPSPPPQNLKLVWGWGGGGRGVTTPPPNLKLVWGLGRGGGGGSPTLPNPNPNPSPLKPVSAAACIIVALTHLRHHSGHSRTPTQTVSPEVTQVSRFKR